MIEVAINLKDLDEIEYAWINHLCCSRYPGRGNMRFKGKFYVFFDTSQIDDELFAALDENEYEYEINDAFYNIAASIDMSGIYEAMDKASSSLKKLSDRIAKGEIYAKLD